VVILAVDSELKVEASFSSRRNLIAVKGGEDFVERLRLVWVKADPEGMGGMCLVFINLGQFFSLHLPINTHLFLLTMADCCVRQRRQRRIWRQRYDI